MTCFLLALVIGSPASDPIFNPHLHSLPSSKALWEARTSWEWEREYEAAAMHQRMREATMHPPPRIETMGDFIIAKLGSMGSSHGSHGNLNASAVDEILDQWYAEIDGLGMMLAAVVASL